MKILCIGQSAYDITIPTESFPEENKKYKIHEVYECGGGSANNASYLLAKWHDEVYLASSIGKDDYGRKLKNELESVGVNTKYIEEGLKTILSEVDEEGNGKIEFKEFVMAMENKSKEDEYTIKQAFAILDRSDSGYITPNDIRYAMICLGENYSLEEVTEMLSLVDEDQDGVINYQEFNKLVKKLC